MGPKPKFGFFFPGSTFRGDLFLGRSIFREGCVPTERNFPSQGVCAKLHGPLIPDILLMHSALYNFLSEKCAKHVGEGEQLYVFLSHTMGVAYPPAAPARLAGENHCYMFLSRIDYLKKWAGQG